MKVLWITNVPFPEAVWLLNKDYPRAVPIGGWMMSSAAAIIKEGVELTVASVSDKVGELTVLQGKDIKYYLIPYGKGNHVVNPAYDSYWREVASLEKPDVVHIHGSEYSHGLSYIQAVGAQNVVVSLQGMMGECSRHFFDGMSKLDVFRNTSFRDLVKRDTLMANYRDFCRRAEIEKMMLRQVCHLIGRTDWDRETALAINPDATYHFCNETLRDVFYSGQWQHKGNRQVFVTQAEYPLKGMHQLLKAISMMVARPHVQVAGFNVVDVSSLKKRLKIGSYGLFLCRLIKRYGLEDNVTFVGRLDAVGMKAALLDSDLFVCPSSVENSSNSIGEAQLLGVPVIASRRGGTPSMVEDKLSGYLYDFDDVSELAALIEKVLSEDCAALSTREVEVAMVRHDPGVNALQLITIYKSMVQEG